MKHRISGETTDWPGNFKKIYWNQEWKEIMYGNESSYIKKYFNEGFDGVYFDIIDAFEFFKDIK